MSACERVRELLLEAEPEDLRGDGDGEVARHLQGCPTCARVAAAVLGATRALDEALTAGAARLDPAAIVARALGPAPLAARPRRVRRPGRWAGVAGLAAAAALAAILLTRPPEAPLSPAPRLAQGPPPLVEVATPTDVAIIQTDNPDITVLWFF